MHKTIAVHQYETLSEHPYEYTESELSREVHIARRGKSEGELNLDEYDLRRSRLVKEFGWGIHYDEHRRLALVGCETEEYDRLAVGAQAGWQSKHERGASQRCRRTRSNRGNPPRNSFITSPSSGRGRRRWAGLAGFEPATHGPGNRCSIP
jgi:hypothetical protein